jgi:hypothetical protein
MSPPRLQQLLMNGEQAEPLKLETWMQDVHQFSGGWEWAPARAQP